MIDEWGIQASYEDAYRQEKQVPPATIEALREAMGEPPQGDDGPLVVRPGDRADVGRGRIHLEDGGEMEVESRLPADVPLGYHTLVADSGERRLIVSPGRCHLPDERAWGWAVQLYATRSRYSWGMGDFADLDVLAGWSRRTGAGMMLVNPLEAVAPTEPRQPSPYFPTSRRFLDPIYLRVEDVPGSELLGDDLARAAAAGRALNDDPLVHRDQVWRLKQEMLERLWETTPRTAFEEWRRTQGDELDQFAVWSALATRHGPDWRSWPEEVRDPASSAVRAFGADHADVVDFHQWLQWLCRVQLGHVADHVTLVQDLPIGFDPSGADAWAWQEYLAFDVTVGAPPDEFNTLGQNWGLPPFVPHRLRAADYEPFVQTIRANLAGGGGLRIDHVMGLFRLFWIPPSASPADGAYVRYPSDDLLDIVALESHRAQGLVVGEDLGTVEPGVREGLADRRMLSYRLLWFEEAEPVRWPKSSMASVTTHDLATVAGLWNGADLEEQRRLELEPNVESTMRIRDRVASLPGVQETSSPTDVVLAVHRRLAESPSRLLCATLDDAAVVERRPNIPGADPNRANWRLALPIPLDDLMESDVALGIADILDRAVDPGKETDDAQEA